MLPIPGPDRTATGRSIRDDLTLFPSWSHTCDQDIAGVTDRNFSRITPGFFVSVGSMGVLGRTTYPGLSVSTYRRPVAALLPQAV